MKRTSKIETAPEALRLLWQEGFFTDWQNQETVAVRFGEHGQHFRPSTLRMALMRASHLIYRKQNNLLEYIQTKPAISKAVDKIENELFEEALIKKFGKDF